jgi:hypothetical protein
MKMREPALAHRGRAPEAVAAQRRPWLFYNARGQVVGALRDGWLTKRVDSRRHQLRRPPAWAVDRAHLERLTALGARGVRLVDERGQTWSATVEAFQRGFVIDRGHGEQVALPLAFWRVEPSNARQLALFDAAAEVSA